MREKEVKEEVIGACVVIAVIVAGSLGAYIVLKPTGQAYQPDLDTCLCNVDGLWQQVMYSQDYVFMPGDRQAYVGPISEGPDFCAQVCASIGGFA